MSYSSGTTVDSVTASDREADAAVSVSEGDSASVKGDVDASATAASSGNDNLLHSSSDKTP